MPAAHPVSRRLRALAAVTALGLLATACGDDDDAETSAAQETTTTAAEGEAAGEYEEYCTATAELDEQDGPPTAEQMEHIKEVRPDEIGEEVDFVADAIIGADGDFGKVFGDPEVEQRIEVIEEFESENCGGEEFVVAPENQPYCDAVAEFDDQESGPTVEQLEGLKEVRPDAIGEDLDAVADALIAADGDFGVALSDPAVEEQLGRVEEWEAEFCDGGAEEDDEDEEAVTEPLEGANVIPVRAVDFAFEGIPAEVPAGPTSFEFTNEGESSHEMFIARLGEGVVLDELLAADEEPTDEQAQDVGGTFSEPGGETTYVNAEELEPGTYAVLCFIPGPEGKPHYDLGMKTTFTVS